MLSSTFIKLSYFTEIRSFIYQGVIQDFEVEGGNEKSNQKMLLNESTAGADASVEMPKLHNIKLLIAFIHMT